MNKALTDRISEYERAAAFQKAPTKTSIDEIEYHIKQKCAELEKINSELRVSKKNLSNKSSKTPPFSPNLSPTTSMEDTSSMEEKKHQLADLIKSIEGAKELYNKLQKEMDGL